MNQEDYDTCIWNMCCMIGILLLVIVMVLTSCSTPKDQFHALSKVVNAKKGPQPVKIPEELKL